MPALSRRQSLIGTLALSAASAAPRRAFAASERLKLRELYAGGGEFSAIAKQMHGKEVDVAGYMAPPLKPDADFFVLTKRPMAVCPFCDNEADWPRNIALVRMGRRQDWINFNRPIIVTGRLDLGTKVDEATGFVSRVRLLDALYRVV